MKNAFERIANSMVLRFRQFGYFVIEKKTLNRNAIIGLYVLYLESSYFWLIDYSIILNSLIEKFFFQTFSSLMNIYSYLV